MNSILKLIFILAFGLLLNGCGSKDSPNGSVGATQRKASDDEEHNAEWLWDVNRAEFDYRLTHSDVELLDDGTRVEWDVEDIDGEKAYKLTETLLSKYGHTEFVKKNYLKIIARQSEYEKIFITQKEIEFGGIKERINKWKDSMEEHFFTNQAARVRYCDAVFGRDFSRVKITELIGSDLADHLLGDATQVRQRPPEAELKQRWKKIKEDQEREEEAWRQEKKQIDETEKRRLENEKKKAEKLLERDKLYRPWIFEKNAMRQMELLGLKPRFVAESHEARRELLAAYKEEKEYAKYVTSSNRNTIAATILLLEVNWSKGEMNVRDGVMTREKMVSIFESDNYDRERSFLIEGLNQLLVRRLPEEFPDIKRTDKIRWFPYEPIETTIEILDRYLENDRIPKPAVSEPKEPENSAPSSQDTPSLTETEISDLLKKESLTLGEITDLLEVVEDEKTRTFILEEKVKSLTLSELDILLRDIARQRDNYNFEAEVILVHNHIQRLKKEPAELARKKLESEFKQPMVFDTKEGGFSVTGIYMASTFKHVRLKRVDNEEDVTVERSLLSDKTNALVKEKEELKRKLESSPDAKK